MVAAKLQTIPRETRMRYWHRSSLKLYEYLYFHRL